MLSDSILDDIVSKIPVPGIRTCSRCGQALPLTLEYFSKHTNGFNSICKICCCGISKQWRKNNLERDNANHKHWQKNNLNN